MAAHCIHERRLSTNDDLDGDSDDTNEAHSPSPALLVLLYRIGDLDESRNEMAPRQTISEDLDTDGVDDDSSHSTVSTYRCVLKSSELL